MDNENKTDLALSFEDSVTKKTDINREKIACSGV
jgi:hypothetical protein